MTEGHRYICGEQFMGVTRRAFLKRTGLGLTALGAYGAGLGLLAERYGQTLAAPARQKLALLVGINQYSETVSDFLVKGTVLNGCLTDVELQRQVLIHRFGFDPHNIVTLTDRQATRDAIESAFLSHLVEQAQPGDVVLFHFSGLGSRVNVAGGTAQATVQNTLVPVDGVLPTEEDPAIRDLPETTLQLLVRSLPTSQVFTFLDVGYSQTGNPLQGNLRIRSRPNAPTGQLLEAEQQFQAQLLNRIGNSNTSAAHRPLPGLHIQAATAQQAVLEGQWASFSAGLLTYGLTHYWWSSVEPRSLWFPLGRAQAETSQVVGKDYQPDVSSSIKSSDLPALSLEGTAAEGVVVAVDSETQAAKLWLAGLPAPVLDNYSAGAILAIAPETVPKTSKAPSRDAPTLLMQVRAREGFIVEAVPISQTSPQTNPQTTNHSPLRMGDRIWEQVRLIPRNLGLTVALDGSLERIERVDATSAFAAARVGVVAVGEQTADYVFGKSSAQVLAAELPPKGPKDVKDAALPPSPERATPKADAAVFPDAAPASDMTPAVPLPKSSYGLFYPGMGVVSGVTLEGEKAVKTAVSRLTAQVRSLLARKLLRLTQNTDSSQLGVQVTLSQVSTNQQNLKEQLSKGKVLWQQQTSRSPWQSPNSSAIAAAVGVPQVATGDMLQYRITNYGDRPLYALLIGWNSEGRAIALKNSAASSVAVGETVALPQGGTVAGWRVQEEQPGLSELFWVFSPAPLAQTLLKLETDAASSGAQPFMVLTDPLAIAQALLQDLNQASRQASTVELPADVYALDVCQWATLACSYAIIQTS